MIRRTVRMKWTSGGSRAAVWLVLLAAATGVAPAFAHSPIVDIISNGLSSASVPVTPLNNSSAENDETVILTLSSCDTYLLGATSAGTVTIADDDSAVVTVAPTDASAGEWGVNPGAFTVTRAVASTAPLTINCLVSGTATGGDDYTALPGNVVIPAGSSSLVIPVVPLSDGAAEGTETVILTLSPATDYRVLTTGPMTGTILNDDAVVSLAVGPPSVAEDGTAPLARACLVSITKANRSHADG